MRIPLAVAMPIAATSTRLSVTPRSQRARSVSNDQQQQHDHAERVDGRGEELRIRAPRHPLDPAEDQTQGDARQHGRRSAEQGDFPEQQADHEHQAEAEQRQRQEPELPAQEPVEPKLLVGVRVGPTPVHLRTPPAPVRSGTCPILARWAPGRTKAERPDGPGDDGEAALGRGWAHHGGTMRRPDRDIRLARAAQFAPERTPAPQVTRAARCDRLPTHRRRTRPGCRRASR